MNDTTREQSPEETPEAALERQVEILVEAMRKLRLENRILRQQQDALVAERALLVEKVERARARIEAMMARLRGIEARR